MSMVAYLRERVTALRDAQRVARAERRRHVHNIYVLLLAIRRYCKHCQGTRLDLIEACADRKCPLWLHRAGPRGLRKLAGK